MDTSTLAQIIGPAVGIIGLGFLFNPKFYMKVEKKIEKRNETLVLGGVINLVIGLLVVSQHNIWQLNSAGLVTLIGWIALLKGITIFVFPKFFHETAYLLVNNKQLFSVAGAAMVILGGYLAYCGFFY